MRSTLNTVNVHPKMEWFMFLVGRWEGETIVHTLDGRTVPGQIRGEGKIILDGAWIEWNFEQDPNDIVEHTQRGRYLFGWCPARQQYSAIYFDDRGNTLIEYGPESAETEGITFMGETVLSETGDVRFEDKISSNHVKHFRNQVYMTINGVRHLHGVFDCHRVI